MTLSVRPSKIILSPRFRNHLEAEFPSKKGDTLSETLTLTAKWLRQQQQREEVS